MVAKYKHPAVYDGNGDVIDREKRPLARRDELVQIKSELIELGDRIDDLQFEAGVAFVHNQMNAAASWSIAHSFGRPPTVTVLDINGAVVLADVEHPSLTLVTITFAVPTAGRATLL